MSTQQFQKGQLVAVRDGRQDAWTLRVFDHCDTSGQAWCKAVAGGPAMWWAHAVPAEEVWPSIFFGRERHG